MCDGVDLRASECIVGVQECGWTSSRSQAGSPRNLKRRQEMLIPNISDAWGGRTHQVFESEAY